MENLSPEEQLLRLIEGEDKTAAPASEPTVVEKPTPKEETTALSFLSRAGSLSKFFSVKTISLKLANRFLTLVSILLALYLVWQISHAQADITRKMLELDNFKKTATPNIVLPEIEDIIHFTQPLKERNIFVPPEKPKPEIPAPVTNTPITIENPPPPPIQVDPLIEQLRKTYKLVGIIKIDKEKAAVTIEKGSESYVLTLNGKTRIQGTIVAPGGDFKYSFRIREVKEDSVTLIEENSNKEMVLGFYQ
jgi:hypothetical protein